MPAPALPSVAGFPLAEADLCVKCGLCLPHCPTYRQTQHEGDSPRGRIALMQALATDLIPLTPKLEQHLDGCLSCRACEPVCPAHVPYGKLLDAGREMLLQKQPQRADSLRRLAPWLVRPALRHLLGFTLWIYQRYGLQWLVRRSGMLGRSRLARLESLLPRLSFPRPLSPVASEPAQVHLFTGCTGTLADRQTLTDALRVLQHLGITTDIPRSQGCCGALHQHAGMTAAASDLARQNISAFGGPPTPILCAASGCAATLLEYQQLTGDSVFSKRVQDITAFLATRWPDRLQLKPLHVRVALHTACTMKNVVKQADAVQILLQKIPGLEIVELDATAQCCGAAGSYFIQQPVMADRLLERKLAAAKKLAPDYIVSGNIGCSLHLAAGLRRAGLSKTTVLHPVTLLARQLDR